MLLILFALFWASADQKAKHHHQERPHYYHNSSRHNKDPSWGYFVGFFAIIGGIFTERAALAFFGLSFMMGFSAVEAALTLRTENGNVVVPAVVALLFLYLSIKAALARDEEEVEQEEAEAAAEVALEQGTKQIIYQTHACEAVVVNDNPSKTSASDMEAGLQCGICTEAEVEKEECSICLEVFQSGEELTAAGCGHFFHTECFSQWVKTDSSEHQNQMRCPVCRFEVEKGIGAPTPACIAHMRPQRRLLEVPTAAVVDGSQTDEFDEVEVDLEKSMDQEPEPAPRTHPIWGRLFGSSTNSAAPVSTVPEEAIDYV